MSSARRAKPRPAFTLTDNVPAGQVVAVAPEALRAWARSSGLNLIEKAVRRAKERASASGR